MRVTAVVLVRGMILEFLIVKTATETVVGIEYVRCCCKVVLLDRSDCIEDVDRWDTTALHAHSIGWCC